MQYQRQQQRLVVRQCLHGPRAYHLGLQMGQRCIVAAWDDTWRIEIKRARFRVHDSYALLFLFQSKTVEARIMQFSP